MDKPKIEEHPNEDWGDIPRSCRERVGPVVPLDPDDLRDLTFTDQRLRRKQAAKYGYKQI